MEDNNQDMGFLLKGIKTEQFATFEKNFKEGQSNISLSTCVQLKLEEQNKQVGIFMGFEFKQKNKPIIKLVVSCHFGIKEDTWIRFITEEIITFPKGFMAHLALLTVGTSRGILFAKTEGTLFSKFILPPLDIAKILTENITFSLDR